MKKYLVNYGTGAGNEEFDTLEEAKENVDFSYTQQSVYIEDENGKKIAVAKWWGVAFDEDEQLEIYGEDYKEPLADFGCGYYENWQEI